MNIDNVVLVRATSTHLPLDGNLIPTYEGKRLVSDEKSEYYFFIRKKMTEELEKQLGRNINPYSVDDSKMLDSILKNYSVLTGDYPTTTLSFSLNGLVPDDINNNFSRMKVAVIDPIKNHINADFVAIDVVDTTIKGSLKVSNEAILVIENELFNSLSEDKKNNLRSNYKINLFEGELREAVNNTLKENNYPVLPLISQRETKNIEECPERESMLEFEDSFAKSVNASRLRLQDLTFSYHSSNEVDQIAHDKIKDEHPNSLKIDEYYRNKFYEFLLNKAENFGIEISDAEKYYLFTQYAESEEAMKRIISCIIDSCGGISNFSNLIQEYNQYVKNSYLTNKEIIDSLNNSKVK